MNELEKKAIQIVDDHVRRFEDGTAWVTRNKGINMRTLWDTIRENYFGIFKSPKDRFGQDKIFYPLTEFMTWENVKNIDIDTKDINITATNPTDTGIAALYRYLVKDWMYRYEFGEQINDDLMYLVLDGHIIKKVYVGYDKKGKLCIKTPRVDVRNTFIDPTADSLHDTAFVERSVQDIDLLLRGNKKWINLGQVKGRKDVFEIYDVEPMEEKSDVEAELYEYWGHITKDLITGKDSDKETYVEGHIIVSNLFDAPIVHKIEENKKGKPYEEGRFEKAPNRWAGRGIGEKVLNLQLYLNIMYNVRRQNHLLLANQLWQYRKGAGIKPEDIRGLVTGGGIGVEQIGDIQRLDTNNLNFNDSINEEQNTIQIGQRVTSTFEAATGESLPSSTPATNAVLQSQAVKSSFALRQERVGLFYAKLFKNQIIPNLGKIYKPKDILRIVDDPDKLRGFKDKLIQTLYAERIADMYDRGIFPDPMQNQILMEEISNRIGKTKDFYTQIENLYSESEFDVKVNVTNEEFDKGTMLQNLQFILTNYQALGDKNAQKTFAVMFDILGIDPEEVFPDQDQVMQQQAQQAQQTQQQPKEQANQTGLPKPNPQTILNNTTNNLV